MSASHPLKTLLLKKSQQLDLNGRRKFAYFVKEKSTAAGCLQQSLALNVCPGKRSLFVTEQLTFQQVLRNGVAVNGDKRAILATATAMNGSCSHFFPCTALPSNSAGTSVPATLRIKAKTDCICGLVPSMSWNVSDCRFCCSWRYPLSRSNTLMHRRRTSLSSSISTGLHRKS